MQHASTPHLNPYGCEIRVTKDKGRGVFATQPIPALTTVDISPVLFFGKDEYDNHGRYTALDHYTFRWRDGRMALALGLGSLFNHAKSPNLSYILDTANDCIRYTTMRHVTPGEELCIFYGTKLWFKDQSAPEGLGILQQEDDSDEDVLARLASVELDDAAEDPDELIPEKDLPFEKVAVTDEEEDDEEDGTIQTVDAWVVDIPDPRKTAEMIQWIKQEGLEHPSLKHTKHVRKWVEPDTSATRTTLLLGPADTPPPSVPDGLIPYIVPVPRIPARTMEQVKLKAVFWPVFFEAQNHAEDRAEAQRWTRDTVQWFRDAVGVLRREAKRVRVRGEMPIVSYVPVPRDAPPGTRSFIAHDTRVSTQHPLRHSVLNVVRLVGDSLPAPKPSGPSQNGQNYLLTSLTLFTTHEPCIACSMALLHSRVKEVVYLYAMPKTGGCGSVTCIPGLKGVNHRFRLWKWRGVPPGGGMQDDVDA